MGNWEEIWQSAGADLWNVPDPDVLARLARWRAESDVRSVLDLGCGTGRHLLPLASEGFQTTGLDHSPSAIAECRNRLDRLGLNARLQCANMTDIPLPDQPFDAVIAFNSIYHGDAAQLSRIAQTLHAILRPGGVGFITLPSRENRMYGKGELVGPHTYLSPGMFAGLFPNDGERGIPHYFSSEDDIRSFFSGFDIVSLDHRELHLASATSRHQAVTWLRVPKAYFWNLEIIRRPHAG